jgi:hypothetical protein
MVELEEEFIEHFFKSSSILKYKKTLIVLRSSISLITKNIGADVYATRQQNLPFPGPYPPSPFADFTRVFLDL